MLSADAQHRTVAAASANRLSLSKGRLTTWHSLMTPTLDERRCCARSCTNMCLTRRIADRRRRRENRGGFAVSNDVLLRPMTGKPIT
jgi:hypothetical protein